MILHERSIVPARPLKRLCLSFFSFVHQQLCLPNARFGSYKCVKSHLRTILWLRRLGLDKRKPKIAETPPQWRAEKLSESEITTLRRSERSRGRCSLNYSPIRFSLTFRGTQHCRMSSLSSALKKEALCDSPSSNSTAPPWVVYFYIGILLNIWCAL
ncbi:hypothetical protein YC2023_103422 [Brassica napus]